MLNSCEELILCVVVNDVLGVFLKSSFGPWFSSGLLSHMLGRDELEHTSKAHANLKDVLKPCGI